MAWLVLNLGGHLQTPANAINILFVFCFTLDLFRTLNTMYELRLLNKSRILLYYFMPH